MERYEWQKHMKAKYLDLAHAMQTRGTPLIPPNAEFDRNVLVNDIKAANELIRACQEYIAEQLKFVGRIVNENGGASNRRTKDDKS